MCKCKDGFIGDGISCEEDPCAECSENAFCNRQVDFRQRESEIEDKGLYENLIEIFSDTQENVVARMVSSETGKHAIRTIAPLVIEMLSVK